MGGRPQSIRFNKVRCGFGTLCIVFLATAGAGAADATPVTGINGLVSTGGPGGGFSDNFSITGAGLISDSLSVGAGVGNADGSHASASNAALADFGRLGVSVAGDGLTPPIPTAGVSSSALASAFWDDTITPKGALPAGTPVTANLLLNLHFVNSALALNATLTGMDYELAAFLTKGGVTSTLVDECFSIDLNGVFCGIGSHLFGVPGNTDPGGTNLTIAPISLSLAIDQPFELTVSLNSEGEGNSPASVAEIGSYSFSGDALNTSDAFLQPLGDFTLVSDSGHDYSPPTVVHGVPEPSPLALLFAGLLSAALWRRRSGAAILRSS